MNLNKNSNNNNLLSGNSASSNNNNNNNSGHGNSLSVLLSQRAAVPSRNDRTQAPTNSLMTFGRAAESLNRTHAPTNSLMTRVNEQRPAAVQSNVVDLTQGMERNSDHLSVIKRARIETDMPAAVNDRNNGGLSSGAHKFLQLLLDEGMTYDSYMTELSNCFPSNCPSGENEKLFLLEKNVLQNLMSILFFPPKCYTADRDRKIKACPKLLKSDYDELMKNNGSKGHEDLLFHAQGIAHLKVAQIYLRDEKIEDKNKKHVQNFIGEALSFFNKVSENYAHAIHVKYGLVCAHNELADFLFKEDRTVDMVDDYNKILALGNFPADFKHIDFVLDYQSLAYFRLSDILRQRNQNESASDYMEKGLALTKMVKANYIHKDSLNCRKGSLYLRIGSAKFRANDNSGASECYNASIRIAKQVPESFKNFHLALDIRANAALGLGNISRIDNDYNDAINYFHDAIDLSENMKRRNSNTEGKASFIKLRAYIGIAEIRLIEEKLVSAEDNYTKASKELEFVKTSYQWSYVENSISDLDSVQSLMDDVCKKLKPAAAPNGPRLVANNNNVNMATSANVKELQDYITKLEKENKELKEKLKKISELSK